tara:strand:- start:143 stop:415 length:273 start_codon:yes stop_codon:yes gene_type:complete
MISDIGGRRPTPDRQPTQPGADQHRHPEPIDRKLSDQEIFDLSEIALKKGGSFEQAMARAIREADPSNKRLILEQWPQLIDKYGPNGWCK